MVHLSLMQKNKKRTKTAGTAVLECLVLYHHFHFAAERNKDGEISRMT